jgi:hypothetical protein
VNLEWDGNVIVGAVVPKQSHFWTVQLATKVYVIA